MSAWEGSEWQRQMENTVESAVAPSNGTPAPEVGVQEAPKPETPVQLKPQRVTLAEGDFLKYQLIGAKTELVQLKCDVYKRELTRAQGELAEAANEANLFMQTLSEKLGIDMRFHMVTNDGFVIPRPAAERDELVRRLQRQGGAGQ